MSDNTIPAKIATAIIAAQKLLKDVPHDKQGPRGPYTSAEAMITACRGVLLESGLALTAGPLTALAWQGDGEARVPVGTFSYRLVYGGAGSSGESLEFARDFPIIAGKGPLKDAVKAASTEVLSYLLRDLLLVSRGDDPETDEHTTTNQRTEPHRTPASVASVPSVIEQLEEAVLALPCDHPKGLDKGGFCWVCGKQIANKVAASPTPPTPPVGSPSGGAVSSGGAATAPSSTANAMPTPRALALLKALKEARVAAGVAPETWIPKINGWAGKQVALVGSGIQVDGLDAPTLGKIEVGLAAWKRQSSAAPATAGVQA